MRRIEKKTDMAKAEEILKSQNYGVLSVQGDDGYPYGVPVNYAYRDGKLYLHGSSKESHKTDAIRRNDKVCFTVIAEHDLIPDKMDTMYTSVIVFGRAKIIEAGEEKQEDLHIMLEELSPKLAPNSDKILKVKDERFVMIEITAEDISGKIGR
jgi:Predicted flavin-nucleotide-binding protein